MGVSEAAAMDLLRQDGLVEESSSGVDRTANMFRETFGLSESAARVAADGRDGRSARSVSEVARRSAARPEPGDAWKLVARIEEFASDLCRRGVPEEEAVRTAAFAVFEAAPDSLQDWVAAVAGRRWPGLWWRQGSSGGNKGSSSGWTSGTVHG
jgi:hypothetical protein